MRRPLVILLVALLTGAVSVQTPVPSLTLVGRGRVSAIYDIEVAKLQIATAGDLSVPVAVVGRDVVLLAGGSGGVVTVDVSEPSRPVVSGTYALPSFIYPSDIAVDRDHIYVAAGEDGLLVFRRPTGHLGLTPVQGARSPRRPGR